MNLQILSGGNARLLKVKQEALRVINGQNRGQAGVSLSKKGEIIETR